MNARMVMTAALALLAGLFAGPAGAEWSDDANENNPVCTAPEDQFSPRLASDGAGGAIIVWCDERAGSGSDIYVQRLDANGAGVWEEGGIKLTGTSGYHLYPELLSDGAGGAFIIWSDYHSGPEYDNYDISAQRVDADGNQLWAAGGVALCAAAGDQKSPLLVSDGAGGVIATWEDRRVWGQIDLYAQRVDADGNPQWPADGMAVVGVAGSRLYPAAVSDGAGGVIVTWLEDRGFLGNKILAQRIGADGVPVWVAGGVPLTNFYEGLTRPSPAADGMGGVIVAWSEFREGENTDVFAQRLNSNGGRLWSAGGVEVCVEAGTQSSPALAGDGAGGAVIAWGDYQAPHDEAVWAQRMDSAGAPQWPAGGVQSSNSGWGNISLELVTDGAGGVIIVWRQDAGTSGGYEILAQRVAPDGVLPWGIEGALECTIPKLSVTPPDLMSDPAGGVIIAWADGRNGNQDIYAQRVDAGGFLGGPPNLPPVALADVSPTSGHAPLNVSFDATASYDPENQPLAYDWDFGDGSPHSAAMIASHIYTGTGTYQALLTVTDDQFLTGTHPVAIEVDTVTNLPPLAVASAAPGSGYLPLTVTFSAAGSHDPEGQPLDYHWDFGDPTSPDNTSDEPNPTHTYANPFTFTAWLTVSDGELSHSAPVTIQVYRTISAELMCWPQMGVLPFDCQVDGSMTNGYGDYHRRLAAAVDVTLPTGQNFTNYRRGYANLAPAASRAFSWTEHLASADLAGLITARLVVQDVTPAPYNQPPYPPAGSTATAGCLVQAMSGEE